MPVVLSCDCRAVSIAVTGDPVACAYCHCATCREFYGVPVLAATAWPEESVTIVSGASHCAQYRHPTKRMRRSFCPHCGEVLFGMNRLGKIVIRSSIFEKSSKGELAPELRPKFHLFYGARVIDVHDELPKYVDGWDGPLFSGHAKPRGE
jgi:hypothetical protein